MSNRNLRIARVVSAALDAMPAETATPPTFAEAVKAPPGTFAEPAGSQPAPPAIADILEQLRAAELHGKPTKDLRQALFAEIARHKSESPPAIATKQAQKSAAPKALVVTARRAAVGKERAELVYEPVSPAAPGESTGVTEILAQMRAAQAKGEPVAPLREALFAAVTRFKGERPAQAQGYTRTGDVSEILQQLREAEAAGRPVGALRQALRDAVERYKRDGAAPDLTAR